MLAVLLAQLVKHWLATAASWRLVPKVDTRDGCGRQVGDWIFACLVHVQVSSTIHTTHFTKDYTNRQCTSASCLHTVWVMMPVHV